MSQAKDKAKELVDRFYFSKISTNRFRNEEAKQCALICVDEMLKNEVNTTMYPNDSIMDYWEEVKQEIEKL